MQNGLCYQPAWCKANNAVFAAVLANKTDSYGYADLAAIARNAILQCRLTKYEKETIILFNEAEPTANIYTYNKALQNRLAKFSRENPKCARLATAYPCGAVSYEVDKKRLSIRFTSPYSEERRAKARNYAIKNNIISNIDSRHKESI